MDASFYNLNQACETISKHYGRDLVDLKFETPMQVVDGCAVKFVENNHEIASARLRFMNKVVITKECDLLAVIMITDIAFSPSTACLTVKLPESC